MSTNIDNYIEQQLESIDEQIEKINNHKVMRAAEKMIEQRNRLQSARRALLGVGNKVTSSGGARVTQGEVVEWFKANPGEHAVEEIASDMGYSPEVIRGHLNRGKGERFTKLASGAWELRDPETDEDEDDE